VKRYRIAPDTRRPLFWFGVVVIVVGVCVGIALTAWWDSRWAPKPVSVPETGGAAIYLPHAAGPPWRWPECVTVVDVYDAWTAAGLVDERLSPARTVGFDAAIPESCVPYIRYRAAGHTVRGELYLCAADDVAALVAVRGPGRGVRVCGPWVVTVPSSVPAATGDALATWLPCRRGQ